MEFTMEFRKSVLEDIAGIMKVINKAKISLKEAGINQWQNGYPNEKVIEDDINRGESYVATIDGTIVGTVAITFDREPHYEAIREGQWMNQEGDYAVIHRIAVDNDYKGQGIAGFLIMQAEKIGEGKIQSIRIDTHEMNLPMQRVIQREGFVYCGKVDMVDGSERVTFEKY